jgi:hypothetical protein
LYVLTHLATVMHCQQERCRNQKLRHRDLVSETHWNEEQESAFAPGNMRSMERGQSPGLRRVYVLKRTCSTHHEVPYPMAKETNDPDNKMPRKFTCQRICSHLVNDMKLSTTWVSTVVPRLTYVTLMIIILTPVLAMLTKIGREQSTQQDVVPLHLAK